MLVVVSLGNGTLLGRSQLRTAANQRASVRAAAKSLAPLAAQHRLVIAHGNGPQVGLLALQGAAYAKLETWPHDLVDSQIEEMAGYMLEQELGSLLPLERPPATVLTMVEVDPEDPAFKYPSRFIGPLYLRQEAEHLGVVKGWAFKPDGDKWRRVVASPEPKRIVELNHIKCLLERETVVIAEGGAGLPVMYEKGARRRLAGVECVIDKDLASELLARELGADLFVMLTATDAVYVDWGKPSRKAIRRVSPEFLKALPFDPGSIGPKVAAACRFASATGRPAVIGAPAELQGILAGDAGTTVSVGEPGLTYATGPLAAA